MNPQEYVAQVEALLRSGRDEEALEFAARFSPTTMPLLGADDFFRVSAALEAAELAISMSDAGLSTRTSAATHQLAPRMRPQE